MANDPKVFFWFIWNERNQRIFKDKAHSPEQIAFKIQALLGESLRATLLPKNKVDFCLEESNWLPSFNIFDLGTKISRQPLEVWEIRMDHSYFEIWMKERKLFKIFFDEASKGNPGIARGGGVVIYPEGNNEHEYCWNIGIDTNNMAEAYGI